MSIVGLPEPFGWPPALRFVTNVLVPGVFVLFQTALS